MVPKENKIFVSFHPDDERLVLSALAQVEAAGWKNIIKPNKSERIETVSELIGQSQMVLIFLSKAYTRDNRLMLEEFAYTSVIERKPFLSVFLDSLDAIQADSDATLNTLERKVFKSKSTKEKAFSEKSLKERSLLLSTLEMLVAKHSGTTTEELLKALTGFSLDQPPYVPSEAKFCQAPCEAYESDNPYIFISYAHDDAEIVYPLVKNLFEAGWDTWYDEGIKPAQSYLPVIADHIKRSSMFVLMLTKRCLERPFIMNYELAFAQKLLIPVVPVLLENVIKPPDYAEEIFTQLYAIAIKKNELPHHIQTYKHNLINHGNRLAILPAIKQNRVYDVFPPPKIQGFETGVYEGGIAITKYIGNATSVIIPDIIKIFDGEKEREFPITYIGYGAFMECQSLTNITLSKYTTGIGEGAFGSCIALKNIILPESIMHIGGYAFGICESLKTIILPESVTDIGDGAFMGCSLLSGITLPKDITRIGFSTFTNCKSLTSVTLQENLIDIGEAVFLNCLSLTDITLPESIISIGDHAFKGCTSLRNIKIPKGVKHIAENAFEDCPISIMGKGLLKEAGHGVAHTSQQENGRPSPDMPAIPCCKEKNYALVCCSKEDVDAICQMLITLYWEGFNIRYEEIPSQQTIDKCACVLAFITKNIAYSKEAMRTLEYMNGQDKSRILQLFPYDSIELPKTIKHNLQALQGILHVCSSVPEMEIVAWGKIKQSLRRFHCCMDHPRGFEYTETGDTVKIVKFHPTGFPHVIIPKTFFATEKPVTSIGDSVFEMCTSLRHITLPESVTHIGNCTFAKTSLTNVTLPKNVVSIGESAFWCCESLTEITIPSGVSSVGACAFRGCHSLTNITLPGDITDIANGTFDGCIKLDGIIIPDKVTSIGNAAFRHCVSLTHITIPRAVTSIGDNAFQKCIPLLNITIPMSVTSIGDNAFDGCFFLTIRTPRGSTAWRHAKAKGINHNDVLANYDKDSLPKNALFLNVKNKENTEQFFSELLKACPLPKENAIQEASIYNMIANYKIYHYELREGLNLRLKECQIYQNNPEWDYTLAISKYSQLGRLASYFGYYQMAYESYNEAYLIRKKNVFDGFEGVKKESISLIRKALKAKEKAEKNKGKEGHHGKIKILFLKKIVIPITNIFIKILNNSK